MIVLKVSTLWYSWNFRCESFYFFVTFSSSLTRDCPISFYHTVQFPNQIKYDFRSLKVNELNRTNITLVVFFTTWCLMKSTREICVMSLHPYPICFIARGFTTAEFRLMPTSFDISNPNTTRWEFKSRVWNTLDTRVAYDAFNVFVRKQSYTRVTMNRWEGSGEDRSSSAAVYLRGSGGFDRHSPWQTR